MLNAGYKHNIVPGQASVGLDLQFLPGQQAESLATVRSYFPDATQFDFSHVDIALETPFVGALPGCWPPACSGGIRTRRSHPSS